MKRELICTNNFDEYCKYTEILSNNNVSYSSRVVNQKSASIFPDGRAHIDSLGLNKKSIYMYYIYVNKKDLAYAKKILV